MTATSALVIYGNVALAPSLRRFAADAAAVITFTHCKTLLMAAKVLACAWAVLPL